PHEQRVAQRTEVRGREREPPRCIQSAAGGNEVLHEVAVGVEHVDDSNASAVYVGPVVRSLLLRIADVKLRDVVGPGGDGLNSKWRIAGRQRRIDEREGSRGRCLLDKGSIERVDLVIAKIGCVEKVRRTVVGKRQA